MLSRVIKQLQSTDCSSAAIFLLGHVSDVSRYNYRPNCDKYLGSFCELHIVICIYSKFWHCPDRESLQPRLTNVRRNIATTTIVQLG